MGAAPNRPSAGAAVQHLVLRVRDIEKSHRFYTEILGFEQCGELDRGKFGQQMRFYRGDAGHHHDLALAQLAEPETAPAPESPWRMFGRTPGIDHIAIRYPDRESWMSQLAWMQANGVEFRVRGNHGMTHSAYIEDPDGNGLEILYDLPAEVWEGDVNAALNHFELLPLDGEGSLEDPTDNVRFEKADR